jgi:hypothetical protein
MRERGSIVCKLRLCLPKGPTNSARMRTTVTAALQRQYLQTELILWIRLIRDSKYNVFAHIFFSFSFLKEHLKLGCI